MMTEETWINGKDAVKFGFADSTTGEMKIAASVNKDWFKNAPESLLNNGFTPEHKHVKQISARMAQGLRKFKI